MRADLTPEQTRAFAELRRKEAVATKFLRDSMEALRAKFKEDMKGVPQSEWNMPRNSAKWQAAYKTMSDSPAYKLHMADLVCVDLFASGSVQ